MTHDSMPESADNPAEQERIRSLLANFSDHASMPATVSDQILFSFAQEQRRRTSINEPPAPAQPATVADLSARRAKRYPLRNLAVAASAAVVLLGGGAVGYAGLHRQSAPSVAVPAARPSNLADRVSVGHTGQDYTSSGLAAQATTLLNSPLRRSVDPAVAQQYGAIATSSGIVSCLGSLGSALAANPDRITVDLARYDGAPAVVVVLTKAGKSTAWVVGTDCRGSSAPLAGPTSLST